MPASNAHDGDSPPRSVTSAANKRSRTLWIVGALVTVGLIAWTVIGSWRSHDPTQPVILAEVIQPGAAAGFNVLLITLDTTRPDHLGCYGYEHARTPTIDSLLDHGVRFDDAVTSVPITLPSHATMLTGRYPPPLGVRTNGAFRLVSEHVTLAEVLKNHGYDTAAFVSCFVLDKRFGLNQGFDVYDFAIGGGIRRPLSVHNERRANDVSTVAIEWLKSRREAAASTPFFAWVHYFDPHAPYAPPIVVSEQLRDKPYDAEIAFVDLHLKRLLNAIDESGMRDRTLIVLASDHGEALMEHGEAYHGVFLYETTVRAALIFSCPTLFDRAYRVDDRVVALADLAPTVLDLLGLPPLRNIEGRSLLAPDPLHDRAIYIETRFPELDLDCGPLFGLRRHTDKYILAPTPEYYDLRADPRELQNLCDDAGANAEKLSRKLSEMMQHWATDSEDQSLYTMSPEEIRRLESLGYVSGGRGSSSDDAPCDPKDHIVVINQMSEVMRLTALEQYEEALALAKELAAQSEGWVAPVRSMAKLHVTLEQWEEAAGVLRKFVDTHPNPEMLYLLASAYHHLRQWDRCEETLQAAEIIDPLLGAIPLLRGDVLCAQGRYPEAIDAYRKAMEIDPDRVGPEAGSKLEQARRHLDKPTP